MSESLSDRLARQLQRLQPQTDGFDRDALLFAAGRASARSRRFWPGLTALLAATQAVTLGILWFRSPDVGFRQVIVEAPAVQSVAEVPKMLPSSSSPYGRALAAADVSLLPLSETVSNIIPPEPIWTVRSVASVTAVD